jgi:hypothetical protein
LLFHSYDLRLVLYGGCRDQADHKYTFSWIERKQPTHLEGSLSEDSLHVKGVDEDKSDSGDLSFLVDLHVAVEGYGFSLPKSIYCVEFFNIIIEVYLKQKGKFLFYLRHGKLVDLQFYQA